MAVYGLDFHNLIQMSDIRHIQEWRLMTRCIRADPNTGGSNAEINPQTTRRGQLDYQIDADDAYDDDRPGLGAYTTLGRRNLLVSVQFAALADFVLI